MRNDAFLNDPEFAQTITFVGSGQITAVFAALIALENRRLKEAGQKPIGISILGKEGSKSLQVIKENGITMSYKENAKSDVGEIKIEPSEFKNLTHDTQLIEPQDHVFVATKACDIDNDLITKINSLKKPSTEINQDTTITFAQNGVPFWLLATLPDNTINQEFRSDILNKDSEIADDGTEKAKAKKLIVESKKLLKQVGKENVVGCVLNVACSAKFDERGNPNYGHYNLSTPISEIGLPMTNIDGRELRQNSNMARLYEIFENIKVGNSKIDIGVLEGDIRKDVFYKLQINAAVNGLCTIYGKNIGELMGDKESEKKALKTAMGIEKIFSKIYPERGSLRNSNELRTRLQRSSKHPTTMQIHFRSGEKIETESIYKLPTSLAIISGLETRSLLVPIAEALDKMEQERAKISGNSENKNLSPEALKEIREKIGEEKKYIDTYASIIRLKSSDFSIINEQKIGREGSSSSGSSKSSNYSREEERKEEAPSTSPKNPSFFTRLISCFRSTNPSNQNNGR